MDNKQTQHWSELKEAGTVKGLLFLFWLNKFFGRWFFNLILYPVMLYYFASNSLARRASFEYLQQHAMCFPQQWPTPPRWYHVFKHLYSFGQCILDKGLGWCETISEDQFEIKNQDVLERFMQKNTGQLIIGSHFGNLEFCRGFINRHHDKILNVLVYDQHSVNFVTAMQKLNPQFSVKVYQVSELDIPLTLQLKARIDAGEWLFIAGDRTPLSGEGRTVPVNFLDRQARFAVGPYVLAKVLQCEVHLMFSYRKADKIQFEVIEFAERIQWARKEQDQALYRYAQRYAKHLQDQVETAPYQWFNFYPYWPESELPLGEQTHAS